MPPVLTSILVVFGFTMVLSVPARRSSLTMRFGDRQKSGRLPYRLREFDNNNDSALDRKELSEYFKSTFDNHDHIPQNVEEAFYVLDVDDDDFINVFEAQPLENL